MKTQVRKVNHHFHSPIPAQHLLLLLPLPLQSPAIPHRSMHPDQDWKNWINLPKVILNQYSPKVKWMPDQGKKDKWMPDQGKKDFNCIVSLILRVLHPSNSSKQIMQFELTPLERALFSALSVPRDWARPRTELTAANTFKNLQFYSSYYIVLFCCLLRRYIKWLLIYVYLTYHCSQTPRLGESTAVKHQGE